MRRLLAALVLLLPVLSYGQLTKLDSLSMPSVDTLEASIIRDEKNVKEITTQTSLQRIDGSKIGRNFAVLGSPDLIKTLQMLPGVSSGSELGSGMYVRGGDGSDNLYLLDGVPMYQVSHLVGLFSSFNSDVIDHADFYKGGFPARFGGRLSSVVDVGVREGNFEQWHGNASLGLIDGRFQIEGPIIKGKTSLNFGVRRTWTDLIKSVAQLFIKNEATQEMASNFHYDFGDFNLKVVHKFTPSSRLTFSGYYGQDLMNAMFLLNQTDTNLDLTYRLKWGNTLGLLRWDKEWGDTFAMDVSAYYTNYSSRMKFTTDISTTSEDEDGKQVLTNMNMHENNLSRIYDLGTEINFYSRKTELHHLRFGGSGVFHTYDPSRDAGIVMKTDGEENLNQSNSQSKRYLGGELAAYFEDEITLGRQWRINLGLRDALFLVSGKAYNRVEPRAAVKFMATDYLDLKGSFSTMNQFSHQVAATYLDLPTNMWMPSTSKVQPMNSNQFVLGGTLRLPFHLSVDIEAFYKTLDHLYEYTGANTMLPQIDAWEEVFKEGRGRAYGLEVGLEYQTDKLQAAAYYTLSKSERLFESFYYTWFPDRYDNRHKLNLSASYRFSRKFELYGAWVFHSGNRFTGKTGVVWLDGEDMEYELYGSPNNFSLPAYHRLDVGFNWHMRTASGNEANFSVSVYNAYNHVNPMFGFIEESDGKMKGIAYGLIPIIPTISYAIKF